MSAPVDFANLIAQSRAALIEREVERRGIKLCGRVDRCGPCPMCGGTDRFSINVKKQLWNCRGCDLGGDVIALVQHLDRTAFVTAVQTLVGKRTPSAAAPMVAPAGSAAASSIARPRASGRSGDRSQDRSRRRTCGRSAASTARSAHARVLAADKA